MFLTIKTIVSSDNVLNENFCFYYTNLKCLFFINIIIIIICTNDHINKRQRK